MNLKGKRCLIIIAIIVAMLSLSSLITLYRASILQIEDAYEDALLNVQTYASPQRPERHG